MLESTLNSSTIYYVMGAAAIGGIISKLIVSITLKKLVRAASDMSKSTHSFIKLVRAKFEHACMVNDQVDNIQVFVEKYIHEYQVLGIRLHGWQRLEKIFVVVIGLVTLLISGGSYLYEGLGEMMLQRTLIGGALLILLLGIYQLVDEKLRLQTVEIYMVDYLENVCAHRYTRGNAEKERFVIPPVSESEEEKGYGQKLEEQMANIERKQLLKKRVQQDQPITQQIEQDRIKRMNEQEEQGEKKHKPEETMPNEAAIRAILQEFMA